MYTGPTRLLLEKNCKFDYASCEKMINSSTDLVIPTYPFEPDAAIGNKWFRIKNIDSFISKIDCHDGLRRSDFLVPHRKGYYLLVFVREGSSHHWIDMKPYVLKPNTFYFATPHQVHLKEEAQPLTGIALSFTEEFLAMEEGGLLRSLPLIQNPHNGHELLLDSSDLAFLEPLLEKIHTEFQIRNDWQNSMLSAYMKVLLIHLSRRYNEQFSENGQFPDKVLLNLSPGHLGDVVREQSGKSAITHIHDRLLLEARRLLFHTDLTAKEIAFELGFEDASYFNRWFKRLAGKTPLDYRDHTRANF
jgi:AraC family transcriptional regulator, transcriptional activator of pobA